MRRFIYTVCSLIGFVVPAAGQDVSPEASGPWTHSLVGSATLSQGAFKN